VSALNSTAEAEACCV